MVDIARHDGTSCGQFAAHQFHAAMLAFRYIAHFRRDDVVARVPHLRHRMILGLHRLMLAAAPFLGSLATLDGAFAVIFQIASTSLVFFDVTAVKNPIQTQGSESLFRIAFRSFGVVVLEWRVRSDARSVRQFDFGVWHFQIVGAEFVFEMYRRGFADMRFVALFGIACGNVDALLLGKLGCGLGFLRIGELLFTGCAVGCVARADFRCVLGFHARCVSVLRVATYGFPTRYHIAGCGFRIIGSCNRGHHEPACRL